MRAFCQRCEKDVEVDAAAPRCPTCLRQSTLVVGAASRGLRDARSAPVPPRAAPMPKVTSVGLTFVAFGFLLVSMVPLELTSWMTLTDLCFVGATVGGLFLLRRAGYFSEKPKATASKGALVVGGVVFGLLAAVGFWGSFSLLLDPLAPQPAHRFGPSHGWGLGTMGLGMAVMIAQLSRALLGKLFERTPELRSQGTLVPIEGAGPNLTEARAYRDGAQRKVVTLEDAAAALAGLPGVHVRIDGLRLIVSGKRGRSPMTLTAAARPELELGKVRVETSDELLALAVSHALLPLLGPHGLELEGDLIAVDGSLTRAELDVAHLQRMGKRIERNQAKLDELFEELKRKTGP